MSEFGLQALPHADTVAEMFPAGAPAALDDPRWAERKLQVAKLHRYAGPLNEGDLVATIEATQRAQAAALQAGIEACRLRREGSGHRRPCGGVAIWQFNEPWAAATWSVVDRRGRTKNAYEMLSRSYRPLLVAARFERRPWAVGETFRAALWLVNDSARDAGPCELVVLLDRQQIACLEDAGVPGLSARQVGTLEHVLSDRPRLLELSCTCAGAQVAENRYDLSVYLPPRQPLMPWLLRRIAEMTLKVG
jgi:hypothetical protein